MYAEVKDNKIVRRVIKPRSYNNVSFGVNATEENYIKAGLYILVEEGTPLKYQIVDNETLDIDGNYAKVIKTFKDIKIEEAINIAIQEAKTKYLSESKRPIVKTSVGYSMDGGYEDINNLKMTYDTMEDNTIIRDAYNKVYNDISKETLGTIIRDLVNYQNSLLENKWNLEEKINNSSNVDELRELEI